MSSTDVCRRLEIRILKSGLRSTDHLDKWIVEFIRSTHLNAIAPHPRPLSVLFHVSTISNNAYTVLTLFPAPDPEWLDRSH